jgi:hypothetical protein
LSAGAVIASAIGLDWFDGTATSPSEGVPSFDRAVPSTDEAFLPPVEALPAFGYRE